MTAPGEELDRMTAPFFCAVGKAITRWQYIETGLFVLMHAILDTECKLSSAIFFHIQSPDAKVKLVDRLSRLHFSSRALQEWDDIFKSLNNILDHRNAMAHWEVNFIRDPAFLGQDVPLLALSRHHLDVKYQGNTKAVTMTTANAVAEECVAMTNRLMIFVAAHFELERLRATALPQPLLHHLDIHRSALQGEQPQPQSSPE